jgi:hypothetical protein
MHAAEALAKRIGVRLFGEAEHLPPFIAVKDGMAARTERQVVAERVQRSVLRPPAILSAQRDLIGPPAVDGVAAQLSLPARHGRTGLFFRLRDDPSALPHLEMIIGITNSAFSNAAWQIMRLPTRASTSSCSPMIFTILKDSSSMACHKNKPRTRRQAQKRVRAGPNAG